MAELRTQGQADLERRKSLLGGSRATPIVSTYAFLAVAVALTAIAFAAIYRMGSVAGAEPMVATLPSGPEGVQVVHADPVPLARVIAHLSVPGRVALNGPASDGKPVPAEGLPLGSAGMLSGGDAVHVCTDLPVPVVELTLVDADTGAQLSQHLFANVPTCA